MKPKINIDYSRLLTISLPLAIGFIKKKMKGSKSRRNRMIDTEFRNERGQSIRITVDDDTRGMNPGMKVTIESPRGTGSWHLTNVEASQLGQILFRYMSQN